ncbi:ABC transporter substrate-binding protein [Virgibacillus halophilus]|uniref:ABC transporter substrate-binding protein n=1 Tax=Tigheibacillus halophilus TaxID=361280 RepID=UPI003645175A
MKKITIFLFAAMLAVLAACGSDSASKDKIDKIVFADAGWDSIRVHNSIAQKIIEEGFGYKTDVTSGSTAATIQGLRRGDINVYMEIWTDNIKEVYDEAIKKGDIKKVSTNFDDNDQGLYVPTYVIKGDKDRGIKPMAPDLKTVADLKKYPDVFKDPEDSGRGRIINGPSGWEVEKAITEKFKTYGLDETMNNFIPGSDSAAVADLKKAYESGKPWVGYYWSPTWVTAKYDLTLLEEAPFDEKKWNKDKSTAFPPNDVVVAVNKDMEKQAPEVVAFLKKYETSNDLTEEALNYMKEKDASAEEAAVWWMKKHEDLWGSWVKDDVAKKVKDAL